MASAVFTIESQPDASKHGLYGSFVFATANFGTLLGGVIGEIMMDSLTDDQLHRCERGWERSELRNGTSCNVHDKPTPTPPLPLLSSLAPHSLLSWGWRVPFLSGILVAGFGFYLKYYEEEDEIGGGDKKSGEEDAGTEVSEGAQPAAEKKKKNPIREAVTTHLRATLSVGMVGALWSAGFYVYFVWGATYMNTLLEPPIEHAFAVNASALLVGVCIFFSIGGR